MKRFFMLCTAVAVSLALGACASGSLNLTAQQKLTNLAKTVSNQCTVAQPFLVSMTSMQTDPAAIKDMQDVTNVANGLCNTAAAVVSPPSGVAVQLDPATILAFVNQEVPKVLAYVKASTKLTQDQKTAAELAVTGAQAALSLAVVNAQ